MDLDQLKRILDLVREHELSEFELEHEGLKLKVRKDARGVVAATAAGSSGGALSVSAQGSQGTQGAMSTTSASVVTSVPPAVVGGGLESDIELAVVKSPIVGTFYRSSEPAAPPFVEIGSTVKKGQVLCIIEAMKLMNEIDSECDGEIVNIYVENGQPVQYGERLFAIRTH
jgi:acetyl-CoA carboxylase biotin carboxyl carrier protein